MFIQSFFSNPNWYLTHVFLIIFSICCHEYAHARVALWQGDDTAASEGHLTLNPLVQMKPFSLIMLAIMGIAWGAVPVNPNRFKSKHSDLLISFAGPFMNLILFFIFTIVIVIAKFVAADASILKFFFTAASLNMTLFIFNMMPIPMLDGGKIFAHFIPALKNPNSEFAKGTMIFMFIAIFSFSQYFWISGEYITLFLGNTILKLISFI